MCLRVRGSRRTQTVQLLAEPSQREDSSPTAAKQAAKKDGWGGHEGLHGGSSTLRSSTLTALLFHSLAAVGRTVLKANEEAALPHKPPVVHMHATRMWLFKHFDPIVS